MLEYALAAGLTSSGGDAHIMHVTTTPSVSYVTRCDEFDCGIMLSASHNPYYDNGIKLFNERGEKMDDSVICLIESYLGGDFQPFGGEDIPFASGRNVGRTVDYVSGRNRYIGHLISLSTCSYKGYRVGLDCANGSSWQIARSVFDALGAKTYVTGAEPNGLNVNDGCGSTHIENLCDLVTENGLDVGFAFDGDRYHYVLLPVDGLFDGHAADVRLDGAYSRRGARGRQARRLRRVPRIPFVSHSAYFADHFDASHFRADRPV